jgi:predicted O-linked N-acetylglucosamine transferase (SPINDLY family)
LSRGGLSLLSNVGHPELVARSPQDFVQIAVGLAHDRVRLARLRAELRPKMLASPLTDGPKFVRSIEDAYRGMWQA